MAASSSGELSWYGSALAELVLTSAGELLAAATCLGMPTGERPAAPWPQVRTAFPWRRSRQEEDRPAVAGCSTRSRLDLRQTAHSRTDRCPL
jgi:hypothetical protein